MALSITISGLWLIHMNLVMIFYQRFSTYLSNISWIMGEKILAMGIAFLIAALVARHLGPDQFGVLSYAFSLVALFGVAGHMGLSGVLVREIVKWPNARSEILGTSFVLKSLSVFLGIIVLIFFIFSTEKLHSQVFWISIIAASTLLLQPTVIFDFWFQAHLKAKYTAVAAIIGSLFGSGFKLILVIFSSGLIWFAVANLIQLLIVAIILFIFFCKTTTVPISTWSFSRARAREFVVQGGIVFLGSIFAIIYLKIDLIMLRWMINTQEVGIYSVAATLSEIWYFVPNAIVASFFPKLIELHKKDEKKFNHRLQQIFDLLLLIAFFVAIFVQLIADPIILIFFGENYSQSSSILIIHIWSGLFIFMRAAFSKWILIENVLIFSVITQGSGALLNIVLNLLLIPHYAGQGAAFATLLSYATASYFSLILYSRTRPIFWMMTLAFFSPIRWIIIGYKRLFN